MLNPGEKSGLGGQLDDPQTWNRYTYVRNDPINLTDPNGESWLSWLVDALLIGADILTSGFFAPESMAILGTTETTLHTANLVFTGALGAAGAATAYEQTKSGGQTESAPQPQVPQGRNSDTIQRINCVTNLLNSQFPGFGFKPQKPQQTHPPQGGHINPTEQATVPTTQAQTAQQEIQNQAHRSLTPGARFPSGLHLPHPPSPAEVQPVPGQPKMSTITLTGHQDTASPVDVWTGAIHLGKDVIWGTLKQKLKIGTGDIDKRCPN